MSQKDPLIAQTDFQKELDALCALSDIHQSLDFNQVNAKAEAAPDPESAMRDILEDVPETSEALGTKWRELVTKLWSHHHPNVTMLPQLTLSAADVAHAPLLNDAKAVLAALAEKPAQLVQENGEWNLTPEDVIRLARVLPSRANIPSVPVEHEWAVPALRRLRGVLLATRLVRPIKGSLVPVRSRVSRWEKLPPVQQCYVLWHADTHHIDWAEFAGMWGPYMHIVQEGIPLLWEASGEPQAEEIDDRAQWALRVVEYYSPIWEEEGLLEVQRGPTAALQVVQQQALPTIVDRFLLRDLLERHGLVTITEEFGSLSKFTWTALASELIPAELAQQLPCGNELLDS